MDKTTSHELFPVRRYEFLGKKLASFTKGAREATITLDDGSSIKMTAAVDEDSGEPIMKYNIMVVRSIEG